MHTYRNAMAGAALMALSAAGMGLDTGSRPDFSLSYGVKRKPFRQPKPKRYGPYKGSKLAKRRSRRGGSHG